MKDYIPKAYFLIWLLILIGLTIILFPKIFAYAEKMGLIIFWKSLVPPSFDSRCQILKGQPSQRQRLALFYCSRENSPKLGQVIGRQILSEFAMRFTVDFAQREHGSFTSRLYTLPWSVPLPGASGTTSCSVCAYGTYCPARGGMGRWEKKRGDGNDIVKGLRNWEKKMRKSG